MLFYGPLAEAEESAIQGFVDPTISDLPRLIL